MEPGAVRQKIRFAKIHMKALSISLLCCCRADAVLRYTHKLWQVVNQSTVNAIFYQIIKSACRHLISPPLVLTGETGSLEKPCFVFIEVTGKVECV